MSTTTDSPTAAPVADTRNAFDRQVEQNLAASKLHHLATSGHGAAGRGFEEALAHAKRTNPRLTALSEGRFEDDAALADAGHPDPMEELRD